MYIQVLEEHMFPFRQCPFPGRSLQLPDVFGLLLEDKDVLHSGKHAAYQLNLAVTSSNTRGAFS